MALSVLRTPALVRGMTPLAYGLLRFYHGLLRVRVTGEAEAVGRFQGGGRVIAALWHQRFLPTLGYVTKFREMALGVMISQSKDGDLIAPIAERLGLRPFRGSSSRGGAAAMAALLEALEERSGVVHIVDGPRGPKGIVKPGLIRMAQLSGAAILPVVVSATRAWVAGSWDRFLIPKPFSTVTIHWGDPFFVPPDVDSDTFERLRRTIEKRMVQAHAEADLAAGWTVPL